ncbi:hypothetical protein [Klebsiella pneumoniae IS39]|nr:hypothetical protein [Klebsiella pneumoniae IS39]
MLFLPETDKYGQSFSKFDNRSLQFHGTGKGGASTSDRG